MSIENQLEKWAQYTVADYNENTEYSYYTQSPLNQIKSVPIKLLILGINPGSDDVKIKEWGKSSPVWNNILGNEGMTFKKLLEGNPFFVSMIEKKRIGVKYEKWNFWEKLCQLLAIAGLNKLIDSYSDYAYTNIYLGSTKGEKDIPKKKYNELKNHAFELIDILQPECIICLGQKVMDSVLEHYNFKNDKTCQVPGLPIRYKLINGMQFYGFHHPAYFYSDAEKKLVGKYLGYYYGKKNITATDSLPQELDLLGKAYLEYKANNNNSSQGSFDYDILVGLLKEHKLSYKEDKKHYWIDLGKDGLEITVSSVNGGTIGIRGHERSKEYDFVAPNIISYMSQLEELGWIKDNIQPNIWLAHLQYKALSEKEICEAIIKTINSL